MLVGIGILIWFIIIGGLYESARNTVDREVTNSREEVSEWITNKLERDKQTDELEKLKSKISQLKKDHKMPTELEKVRKEISELEKKKK